MRINYNYWKLGAFIRASWKTGLNTQIAELSHGFFPDPAQSFTLGANPARPVVKFPLARRLIRLLRSLCVLMSFAHSFFGRANRLQMGPFVSPGLKPL